MPADELPRALAVAKAFTSPGSRADALTRLVPHVPVSLRPEVLTEALVAARASGDHRPWALIALLPYLPASQQREALTQALAAAILIKDNELQDAALGVLAPLLPCDLLPKAVTATSNEMTRGALLERAQSLLD